MRILPLVVSVVLLAATAAAEVTNVTITARTVVANGQAFGAVGAYERLTGTIEFALDPATPRNRNITDLALAPRAPDGRVHFSADLLILKPVDATRGNGVLLFEVPNRGRVQILRTFNFAPEKNDFDAPADFGNGFLLREGYTVVWIGWEHAVPPGRLHAALPKVQGAIQGNVNIEIVPNDRRAEIVLDTAEGYLPIMAENPRDTLTVRDRLWDAPTALPRNQWRFLPATGSMPRIFIDGGPEPGRIYDLTYEATGAIVLGAGSAAIRDAAAAFRYRADLAIQGRFALIYGESQSGRFLRQWLHLGFNVDERGRRVFDAAWAHIAGAAQGPFNERFGTPGAGGGITFPFVVAPQRSNTGERDGLLEGYPSALRPKLFLTNSGNEYWNPRRGAVLTHVTPDGARDLSLQEGARVYYMAGTQHNEAPFPPSTNNGHFAANITPYRGVLRALMRHLHKWTVDNTMPPADRVPLIRDRTLTHIEELRFPSIPGTKDPRQIARPFRIVADRREGLPFLVPQVDADGNDIGGIRVPEQMVPLATTMGWTQRAERIGNLNRDVWGPIGAYIPFPRTRADREATKDPRRSIEQRYASKEDYLRRIDAAAERLVNEGFLLSEDVSEVRTRAAAHWDWATKPLASQTSTR